MKKENAQNELPIYMFHQGSNFYAQDFFGCRFDQENARAVFRVWAPNAREVSVVGDWNGWAENAHPMRRISETGVWACAVEGVQLWQRYKFAIFGPDNVRRHKADPFAFHAETDGQAASIVYDIEGYPWRDSTWMAARPWRALHDKPVNIYELHAGSWRRHEDGRLLSYTELADALVPYLTEMGYTHLELLPIMEHSLGRTWGYQICGYFAATSRYGTPHDLMALIDRCHQAGIGVILDWVPAYFPKDAHGLAEFDGGPVFEAPAPHGGERRDWGSCQFDYGSAEVQSFLISNAVYWLTVFHADGLRIDAVSSMLCLDYGKKQGEWVPNADGGNENLEAVAFLQKLNRAVNVSCPGAVMIAEESTSWPMMTKPSHEGGLGFHFQWNVGWTSDMREYVSVDPLFRKMVHDKITLSLYYAFSESFILPMSHDVVVYGRGALIDKMPGERGMKFAGIRAFLGYMMAHPGKKLNFMGYEIGQFSEWDHETPMEWPLLGEPDHAMLQGYVKALNHFYLDTPALWEIDGSWEGFRWISADDNTQNIVIFMRIDKAGNALIVLQNFAPVLREDYCFGVPEEGVYEEVFNSDRSAYGGWGHENEALHTGQTPMHGFPYSLCVTAPPLSSVYFRLRSLTPKEG